MSRGVIVVDKPQGLTSFDVVARCRRIFSEKRVGHTGTLDPMATGVLPVCLGEATKLVPMLQDTDKEYDATALLGVETDSEDATGVQIAEADASGVTPDAVAHVLTEMVGSLKQTPPMHSAVRVGGERLYHRAHRGEVIDRPERTVQVYALAVTSFAIEGARARVGFSVRCGKGTYVRTLASELGRRLGVGGHLSALRRTQVGGFALAGAVPLALLTAETPLLGLADALSNLPKILVADANIRDVRDGKLKFINTLDASLASRVRLIGPAGQLLAVAHPSEGKLVLERVFNDVDIDMGLGPNAGDQKNVKQLETKDL